MAGADRCSTGSSGDRTCGVSPVRGLTIPPDDIPYHPLWDAVLLFLGNPDCTIPGCGPQDVAVPLVPIPSDNEIWTSPTVTIPMPEFPYLW
jgi:hypothetical protein